jgi:WD40 repeat protein
VASDGALVGVGRGTILSVATNDLFTRARFEVPPRTTFLAQRTIVSADATLGAYADLDERGPIISVFDLRTGARKHALRPRGGYVTALAFSRDRTRLVSSVYGGGITFWDVATGARSLEFRAKVAGSVYGFAFSHDDRLLATGEGLTVRLRDAQTAAPLHELGPHTSGVEALAFSADGQILYAGDNAGWVRIWDTQTGRLLRTTRTHEDIVRAVIPLGDGQRFVTGSRDGTARLWHRTRDTAPTTIVAHSGGILALVLSRDEQRLATTSYDGSLRISDVARGRELRRIGYDVVPAVALAFPSSDTLLVGMQTGARQLELGSGTWGRARGLPDGISALGSAPNGRLIALTNDHSLKRYERKANAYSVAGDITLRPGPNAFFPRDASVELRDLEQASDVVAAFALRRLFVWTNGGAKLAFEKSTTSPRDIALSPDGSVVAVATAESLDVVTVPSGASAFRKVHELRRQSTGFTALAFSADGQELGVADSLGAFLVVDRSGMERSRHTLRSPAVRVVALRTAAGKFLAALSDGSLALIDPRANRVSDTAAPPSAQDSTPFVPIALAASPDDRFVAVGYRGRPHASTPLEGIASVRLFRFDGTRIELVVALAETNAAEGILVALEDGRVEALFDDPKAAGKLLRCSLGAVSRPLETCAKDKLSPGLFMNRIADIRRR